LIQFYQIFCEKATQESLRTGSLFPTYRICTPPICNKFCSSQCEANQTEQTNFTFVYSARILHV